MIQASYHIYVVAKKLNVKLVPCLVVTVFNVKVVYFTLLIIIIFVITFFYKLYVLDTICESLD